jgi:adenosylhomocysteine nucleosidase
VEIGGGTPEGAALAASRLLNQGVTGLVSFGLAGGLDPALRPGDLLCPARVGDLETDPDLAALFGGLTGGSLWAGDKVIATVAGKQALFRDTGAAAVDLESGAVASAAKARGLPFIAVRAICDPADRALPPAALVALGASGGIGLLRVLGSVARQPGQVPALLRLAGDAAAARRALVTAVREARSRMRDRD